MQDLAPCNIQGFITHFVMYSRCYISVAVLNGKIYALGGYDGANRQNTAERYDPTANQWSLIAPMQQQRSDASATSLNGENLIDLASENSVRRAFTFCNVILIIRY